MTKVFKSKRFGMFLLLLMVSLVWTSAACATEVLKGRDIARMGKMVSVAGELHDEGGEWFLRSDGTRYALHMGPESFRSDKGLILKRGQGANVKGFLYESDIAVTSVESEGKTLVLRDESGRPAWAGTGYGRQANVRKDGHCGSCDYAERDRHTKGRGDFRGLGELMNK